MEKQVIEWLKKKQCEAYYKRDWKLEGLISQLVKELERRNEKKTKGKDCSFKS